MDLVKNNYVIIMPKNNSYIIKVENICPKRYLEILVAFIVLQFLLMKRLYFLGADYMDRASPVNRAEKCHENLPGAAK
jgi:hypothetical protein